jgi:hypothetical protein
MSDIVNELRGWPGSPERALHTMMKAAAEIVLLRVENDHLKQARSDALAGGDALRDEITRLRARVEGLEKVRAAAQALIDVDACDDPAEDGWWDWEKNCEALRAALKEAKP